MGRLTDTRAAAARHARRARVLVRLGARFLTDHQYQAHVIDTVQRQASASERYLEATTKVRNADWLKSKRMYLVGGCELTYIKEYFERLGVETYHTFDHGRSSDPLGEVIDDESPIWGFRPDFVVLSQVQVAKGPLHAVQTKGSSQSRTDQDGQLEFLAGNYGRAIDLIRDRISSPIVAMTHPLFYRPALGITEYRSLPDNYSMAEFTRRYELAIYETVKHRSNSYVLDVGQALELNGKETALASHELLGEHFTREGGEQVAAALRTILHAINSTAPHVKCAVFDLDETLWTGIIRESGPGGVIVRRPNVRAARYLAKRGILLAVCSKNDPVELELLPKILGQGFCDLLVAQKVTWGLKSEAIREIAAELNIGLDSIALFDDNVRERAEVGMNAPEVLVLSDTDIVRSLAMPEFQPFGELTAEAEARASMYRAERDRKTAERAESGNARDDFLASLKLRLEVRPAAAAELGRVQELLQRTNQLNATLKRTSAGDLTAATRGEVKVFVGRLADKFGDYGIIGAAIVRPEAAGWRLEEFAFSCRAMGRGVEQAFIAYLTELARTTSTPQLRIPFVRTERNGELWRILTAAGFAAAEAAPSEGAVDLVLDPNGPTVAEVPSWIDFAAGADLGA